MTDEPDTSDIPEADRAFFDRAKLVKPMKYTGDKTDVTALIAYAQFLEAEADRLREQLGKRTTALEQIVAEITPGYGGTLGAIRKCAAAALTDDRRNTCPNGLEHGNCLHPNCVTSCPGRISLSDEERKSK